LLILKILVTSLKNRSTVSTSSQLFFVGTTVSFDKFCHPYNYFPKGFEFFETVGSGQESASNFDYSSSKTDHPLALYPLRLSF
jgi:hypothetical protein